MATRNRQKALEMMKAATAPKSPPKSPPLATFSRVTPDTDTWRSTRAYRMGRAIERRRANRWLRNTAQGPSRKLYT
jgi:hypothetical protein